MWLASIAVQPIEEWNHRRDARSGMYGFHVCIYKAASAVECAVQWKDGPFTPWSSGIRERNTEQEGLVQLRIVPIIPSPKINFIIFWVQKNNACHQVVG